MDNGAPYSVHDVTQNSGSEITANSSGTLTFDDGGVAGQYAPANGDSIQILRATACIDQAGGRGAGYLYSGTTPQTTPASQAASPSYEWMDATTGSATLSAVVGSDTARVIANRDFYEESVNQTAQTSSNSPFNGTSGTGHGITSRQPSTCTKGVAYWDTTNNWLNMCTATNTWTTDAYIPYTYPHPLDSSSGSPSPAAPQLLFTLQ